MSFARDGGRKAFGIVQKLASGGDGPACLRGWLKAPSGAQASRLHRPPQLQRPAAWRCIHIQATRIREQDPTSPRTEPASASTPDPGQTPNATPEQSRRLQNFVDDLLAKAAVANQQISMYAGTDYSHIHKLREDIAEQEQLVSTAHANVDTAKLALDSAHAAQTASNKEVVSLLERKSSWSAADLDRYTSLIRSEHGDEQNVISARQALLNAGKELETRRTELQRKTGQLYQEQQLRSDTIAQNGTWFAVVLMGVNVLLLVVNIVVFEPWRRKKIVREFEAAFERHSGDVNTAIARTDAALTNAKVVEAPVEAAAEASSATLPDPEGVAPLLDVEVEPTHAALVIEPRGAAENIGPTTSWWSQLQSSFSRSWSRTQIVFHEWWRGPLSDDTIQLKKVEMTSIALEGAAAALAVTGCIALALRSS